MKEKIYTIPVTEAFGEAGECPLCTLERKLENEYTEYTLGPSLMEPDSRIQTNDKGFCRHHFELLFNSPANKLGLGLIIETMMAEQNERFNDFWSKKIPSIKNEAGMSTIKAAAGKLTARQTETERFIDDMTKKLNEFENSCVICDKIAFTMDRYIDVTLYLWSKEPEFRQLFNNCKGFCLPHMKDLLAGAKKYMEIRDMASFVDTLIDMQKTNLERIKGEVGWFNKKFDYRFANEPWGNSRDSIQRSIQKLSGYCRIG
ncbi:MAG: DUF6062 family protein [Bacillota bacterium]|nr:DUF6062 family protein [Bacillota bacterium]